MVVSFSNKSIRLIAILLVVAMVIPVNAYPVRADATFSISGAISPAFSVTQVKFNDGQVDWPGVMAPDGLSYSITGFAGEAAGTVTAKPAAGYTLEPANGYAGLMVTSDQEGLDFRGIPMLISISGNAGVPSVDIHPTGVDPVSANDEGNYSFKVPYNWSGVVVPSLAGFRFTPEKREFSQLTSDQILDFTAEAVNLAISGNAGMPGVVLEFSGVGPVVSDETGAYSASVPYGWSGSVTPSLAGYHFSPESQTFNPLAADQVLDFSPVPDTYTISGNTGAANTAVFYTDGPPVYSDAAGAYNLTVPAGWTGTINVSLEGYEFSPSEQVVVDVQENRTLDFNSQPVVTNTPLPTETPAFTSTPLPTATPEFLPTVAELPPTTGMPVVVASVPATSVPAASVPESAINAVGAGTYDDTSSSIQYTGRWKFYRGGGPLKRTDHYTQVTDAEASLVFYGTHVDYYYVTYKTRGHVRITIDGIRMADLDLYSRKLRWRQIWSSPVLEPGIHTITITRLDGYIDVDAFIVTEDDEPRVEFTQTAVPQNTATVGVPTEVPPTSTYTSVPAATQTATILPTSTPVTQPTATKTSVPTFTPTMTPTFTFTPTNTPTAIPSFTPTTVPSSGGTVFSADFESGDLSAFDGSAGEIFGKGAYYDISVANSPAIGGYSAALTIGSGRSTAAYLFTYAVPRTELGIYSADFYIPGNVVPDNWWNVMQWKSVDNTYNMPIIHMNILEEGNGLMLIMFYTAGGTSSNPNVVIAPVNPMQFPTDRWVNITAYYLSKSDNSGYIEIYQDGVKMYDMRGFLTKPGGKDVLWSVNSYADRISPNPATIYIDNMKITEG